MVWYSKNLNQTTSNIRKNKEFIVSSWYSINGTLYQRRIPLYFYPLAPENGGFSVFLSVIFVLLMYQTQAWRITVRFVFLCFCKRKMERRFAYTLLNQQMNHLLIIIYIIGTHTCFHKNAKMQNMSTKSSLHDL